MLQTHFHLRKNNVLKLSWQSHNKMVQKGKDTTSLLEKGTCYSSASPQETANSQLLGAGKHGICWQCYCTSIRAAPQPLTQFPKPGGTSSINVLTPAGSPWRLAPSWSLSPLSEAARGKGRGQAPSHCPIPSVSAALLHFPLCGIIGVFGKSEEGKGKLQWGMKTRRSSVSLPLATPRYKSLLESDVYFSLLPPSPLPNKS